MVTERAREAERDRKRMADPEVRARRNERARERLADPVHRARIYERNGASAWPIRRSGPARTSGSGSGSASGGRPSHAVNR